ncbi:hypothetical protein G6F64_003457 [Rhizopus arrhizus]|uniref:Uncharacterized protein n=2 Tax=Rhizopus oryzae TaxID=64495 RepID=A0A9P7BUQ4_RHIOR|nr:hypothetical protein G6F64_003457 [Rhizopus arrhizus]
MIGFLEPINSLINACLLKLTSALLAFGISKASTRTFNTGRFSVTRDFTADQQTILNAFNRIRDNAEVQSSSVPTETEPSVEQELVSYEEEQVESDEVEDTDDEVEEFISDSLPEDSVLSVYFESIQKTKDFNEQPHTRRIIGLNSCFYLMSMRYRCLSSDCGKTINAHDSLIIKQLPYGLQLEFPAVLIHRGGVSKAATGFLRPCIQNSVGSECFQKILIELHHLRHDRLEF